MLSVGGGQWYSMVLKLGGVTGACEPLTGVTGTELWPSARIGSVLTSKLPAHVPTSPQPPFSILDTGFYVVQADLKVALSSIARAGVPDMSHRAQLSASVFISYPSLPCNVRTTDYTWSY